LSDKQVAKEFQARKNARNLRLLISEDDPETRLVAGYENGLLHKKTYFDVDSAPPLAADQ